MAPRRAGDDLERRAALRDVLRAFVSSRLLIAVAGVATMLVLGPRPGEATVFDPHSLTNPFHTTILNLLLAPTARWDSSWFLEIARSGYRHGAQTVFFPVYPLLIAILGSPFPAPVEALAGVLVSCLAAVGGLYLLHRLVSLELGAPVARNTVWIVAWLPIAIFLSTVYSEAVFLLLAVGSFYAARLGRWWVAGLAGALAAATRNSGVLLVVPLLVLYLYGPRADREPERPAAGLRPRYRVRRGALWIAVVPLGLLAYLLYLKLTLGHPLAPFRQEHHWRRSFSPLAGIPLGVEVAAKKLIALLPGGSSLFHTRLSFNSVLRPEAELLFLVLALLLLWQCWKRLPFAYTAFAAISLAASVSAPSPHEPLRSLPRFTLVLFPLWIALALWATERRRVRLVIAVCAPLVAFWTYLFTSWTWAG